MERIDKTTLQSSIIENAQHTHRYKWVNKIAYGKVLDIACGIGYGSCLLINPQITSYLGIDISPEAIITANKNYGNNKKNSFKLGDIFDTKLDNASIDTIISFETIEHVSKPSKAIKELSRILSHQGILVGSVPTYRYEQLCTRTFGKNKYHLSIFTIDKIKKIILRHFKYCKFFLFSEIFGTLVIGLNSRNLKADLLNLPKQKLGSYIFVASNNKKSLEKIVPTNELFYKSNIVELIASDFLSHMDEKDKYIKKLENSNSLLNKTISIKNEYINEFENKKNNI